MSAKPRSAPFDPEICEWAVRVVLSEEIEAGRDAAVQSVAARVGCAPQTLLRWLRKAELAGGMTPGLFTNPEQRIRALERELVAQREIVAMLRQDLKAAGHPRA